MKKNTSRKTNAGFSLVELIAVIAVIAILATIAIPLYGDYTEKAKVAADSTYINECYRASAVISAEEGDPLYAISVNAEGQVLVCHEKEDDDSLVFCDDCSTEIAEIIGGMQPLQSKALIDDPTAGDTVDIDMGTLTYTADCSLEGGGTADGWVLIVEGSVNPAVSGAEGEPENP